MAAFVPHVLIPGRAQTGDDRPRIVSRTSRVSTLCGSARLELEAPARHGASGRPRRGRAPSTVVAWLRGWNTGDASDCVVVREAKAAAAAKGASVSAVRIANSQFDPNIAVEGITVDTITLPRPTVHTSLVALQRYCSEHRADLVFYNGPRIGVPFPALLPPLIHVHATPAPPRLQTLPALLASAAAVPHTLITENIGNDVLVNYTDDPNAPGALRGGKPADTRSIPDKIVDALETIYLPAGYPHSVTTDYLAFSEWRAIQNLASSIMAVVSTEALLFGLGLGKTATAATAAATQWVLKDGLGYIGKVMYGYAVGKQFDHDPKSWRVVSDAVEDFGGVLELLTPVFPGNFLALASVANALKGVAAMTGTATRHAIYKSLALHENQGDIATKGESQGVTCKMLGLALGIGISSAIGQNYGRLLLAYSAFASVHLIANWQSMKCVQFATLNRQRAAILMDAFLRGEQLPGPHEVSHLEKMILTPWAGYQPQIVLGASVRDAFRSSDELQNSLKGHGKDAFLITCPKAAKKRSKSRVFVVLRRTASSEDILKAFFAARIFLSGRNGSNSNGLDSSRRQADRTFKRFVTAASKRGWNTYYSLLNPSPYRSSW